MEIWICRGDGRRRPRKLPKILKKISRKINGKRQTFDTFHAILANFDVKKLILIKIKAILMEFCKALIMIKEIKKSIDKFLHVNAKNQLRFQIFEKILKFTCKNLNGKLIFLPIFTSSFHDVCHFIQLRNIPKFLEVAWGVVSPGFGGW